MVVARGHTAYGDGGTRQEFADAGRRLVARLPGRSRRPYFAKEDFHIDFEADTCACPRRQRRRRQPGLGNSH